MSITDIILDSDIDGRLQVDYLLGNDGVNEPEAFHLDMTHCPLALMNIWGSATLKPREEGELLVFQRGSSYQWNGSIIRFAFKWPDPLGTSAPPLLICPHHFPLPLEVSAIEPHIAPNITFRGAFSPAHYVPIGFPPKLSRSNTSFLQLTLSPSQLTQMPLTKAATSSLYLSPGLRTALAPGYVEQMRKIVQRFLTFITDKCGLQPSLPIVCATADEVASRISGEPGGLIILSERDLAEIPAGSFEFSVEVGRQLTGILFGSLCRVIGRNAEELRQILSGFLTLWWANTLNEPVEMGKLIQRFRQLAARKGGGLRDSIRSSRPEYVARLSLELFLRLDREHFAAKMRNTLEQCGGTWVSDTWLVSELDVGSLLDID